MTELGASSKLNAEWAFFEYLHKEGRKAARDISGSACEGSRQALDPRSGRPARGDLTHGAARHPRRARLPHLARLSRLEHSSACARRLDHRRGIVGAAAARALDADVHGERRAVRHAILPDLSARRAVRQADGRQRLGVGDRDLHDRAPWRQARRAGGGARRRAGHLWRRQPVRRLLRARADGACAVSRGRDPEAADAGGDRARHVDLHHVDAARHARDPERHPDAVLRHDAVRRARALASSRR